MHMFCHDMERGKITTKRGSFANQCSNHASVATAYSVFLIDLHQRVNRVFIYNLEAEKCIVKRDFMQKTSQRAPNFKLCGIILFI